jgi:hypothetical protein
VGDQVLHYRLPLSAVRVSGTLKRTKDTILNTTEDEPTVGVEMVTVADASTELELKYSFGPLNDTTVGLERLEDGRLASSSSESTGQGTKVITAVTGIAATGVGFALAGVPGAALVATAAAAAGRPATTEEMEALLQVRVGNEDSEKETDDEKIAKKYHEEHAGLAKARVDLAKRVELLRRTIGDLAKDVIEAGEPDVRKAKVKELRAAEAALNIVRAELEGIDRHFKLWREATLKSRLETIDLLITLDEIAQAGPSRVTEAGALRFPAIAADATLNGAQKKVKRLWDDFDVSLVFDDDPSVPNPVAAGAPDKNQVVTREPRWVTLKVYERDGKRRALKNEKRYAVVDGKCNHRTFELRSSFLSRKSSKVTFSTNGIATGFASGSTSAVAAAAEALGQIPAQFSAGLKTAGEITDSVHALKNKALDIELAKVKKAVELRQQQLLLSGLDVTDERALELDWLKQQQAILEGQKAIIEAENSLEELRAPAHAPTDLQKLNKEIELLRAQLERAVLQGAVGRAADEAVDVADIYRYATRAES